MIGSMSRAELALSESSQGPSNFPHSTMPWLKNETFWKIFMNEFFRETSDFLSKALLFAIENNSFISDVSPVRAETLFREPN